MDHREILRWVPRLSNNRLHLPLVWFSVESKAFVHLHRDKKVGVRNTRTQTSTCVQPPLTEHMVCVRPLLSLVQAQCHLIFTTTL